MRFGIVGCGLIGQKRAIAAMAGGHEIVAVADLDSTRSEALASKTGAKPTSRFQDVTASDVDIVVIATRHDSLASISISAIEAGKHVLVEKPAGRNLAEALQIAAAATRMDKLVKIGFNHRFHPAMQKAKEICDSGALGPILCVRGRYGHGGRIGYDREWRCDPELSGGGELIDQGSHLIDLARWFMGDLSLGYAHLPTLFWKIPVDDNCFLALTRSDGATAWLHASWSEWKNIFSFEISGRDGKLAIDGLGGSYGIERLTYYQMLPEMGPPETTAWEFPMPDGSWEAEVSAFADAIVNRRKPLGDIDDAVAMHRIIDQAYGRTAK